MPRFYLSAFESAPKQIHLFNLKTGLAVQNAGLRHQCYRHGFYGPDDRVEKALAELEAHAAPVLRWIRARRALPPSGSGERVALLAFVALQALRTTVMADRNNAHLDKLTKQIYAREPQAIAHQFEASRFEYENPVLPALRHLPLMLEAIADLSAHLVVSCDRLFVTSDNPAFRYNQYCEHIDHVGTTGALNRGFQAFVPLAPDLCLVLFDPTTYTAGLADRWRGFSLATTADEEALNTIQLVAAAEQIYFSDWTTAPIVRALAVDAQRLRIADPTVVVEYGQDDDPSRSLVHSFVRTPCLDLKLSFLEARRCARRVPLLARAQQVRRNTVIPAWPESPDRARRPITFSRFLGRR